MSDEANQHGRRSSFAEAAATRWRQAHPDEEMDIDHDAPSHIPEPEDEVPNRHSASAEAASLRWHERHFEDF